LLHLGALLLCLGDESLGLLGGGEELLRPGIILVRRTRVTIELFFRGWIWVGQVIGDLVLFRLVIQSGFVDTMTAATSAETAFLSPLRVPTVLREVLLAPRLRHVSGTGSAQRSDRRKSADGSGPDGLNSVPTQSARKHESFLILSKPHLLEKEMGFPVRGKHTCDLFHFGKLLVKPQSEVGDLLINPPVEPVEEVVHHLARSAVLEWLITFPYHGDEASHPIRNSESRRFNQQHLLKCVTF
jgi:hypothetical protein